MPQHSAAPHNLGVNPRIKMDQPLLGRYQERGPSNLSQLRSGESDSSGTLFHSPSAQESGGSKMTSLAGKPLLLPQGKQVSCMYSYIEELIMRKVPVMEA